MPAKDYGPVTIINAETGEVALRDLTPDEVATRDAERAAAAAENTQRAADDAAKAADLDEVRTGKLATALTALQADLAILQAGAPSPAQQRQIMTDVVRAEIAIMKALARLVG